MLICSRSPNQIICSPFLHLHTPRVPFLRFTQHTTFPGGFASPVAWNSQVNGDLPRKMNEKGCDISGDIVYTVCKDI